MPKKKTALKFICTLFFHNMATQYPQVFLYKGVERCKIYWSRVSLRLRVVFKRSQEQPNSIINSVAIFFNSIVCAYQLCISIDITRNSFVNGAQCVWATFYFTSLHFTFIVTLISTCCIINLESFAALLS